MAIHYNPNLERNGNWQDCSMVLLCSVLSKVFADDEFVSSCGNCRDLKNPGSHGKYFSALHTDGIPAQVQQGMLAACIDLKKAFDSVHRGALWDLP